MPSRREGDLTAVRRAWHRCANGERCEVEVYLDLIHRDHRPLLLATVLDLTVRKAAEAALRDSEEGYRSALAEIDAGDAAHLRVVATWGDANALPSGFPLDDCWAMRRGEVKESTARPRIAQCRHFAGLPPSAYLCVPLTVRGETFGLLHLSACATQTATVLDEMRALARVTHWSRPCGRSTRSIPRRTCRPSSGRLRPCS